MFQLIASPHFVTQSLFIDTKDDTMTLRDTSSSFIYPLPSTTSNISSSISSIVSKDGRHILALPDTPTRTTVHLLDGSTGATLASRVIPAAARAALSDEYIIVYSSNSVVMMPFTAATPREKMFENEIVSVSPHAVVTTRTIEVRVVGGFKYLARLISTLSCLNLQHPNLQHPFHCSSPTVPRP